jgi:hypothetical protein
MRRFSTGGNFFIAAIIVPEAFLYGVADGQWLAFGVRPKRKGLHFAVEPK